MFRNRRFRMVMLISLTAAASFAAEPSLRPADLFADHMVLQQQMDVPVWGRGEPGRLVTVTLEDCRRVGEVEVDGTWIVRMDPPPAGGPYTMAIGDGATTLTYSDVLVGEVWLCAGQSNMEHTVNASIGTPEEFAELDRPAMRLFSNWPAPAEQPQIRCSGRWQVCTPETGRRFSAVGYFFGRTLANELNVPVGLIQACRGGASIEAYTPTQVQQINPMYSPALRRWEQGAEQWPVMWGKYWETVLAWQTEAAQARAAGLTPPPEPMRPGMADASINQPGSLFNGQVAPLVPYAVRGAVWYQGEANSGRAWQYRQFFPSMIHAWRAMWGQPHFYFYFVQLPNFGQSGGEESWPEQREAQALALEVPETAMAVTIDVGDAKDIHPPNKQDVGLRLALPALHHIYGKQDVVWSGPVFESMQVQGGHATLSFSHAEGLKTRDGGPVKGFAIAGADRQFHPAEATVKGDRVIVSAAAVAEPVAVRYAWAGDPGCNLYNGAGLPAAPFRTDRWPGKTDGLRQTGWQSVDWSTRQPLVPKS